jgi:signal transduction histidine kinase
MYFFSGLGTRGDNVIKKPDKVEISIKTKLLLVIVAVVLLTNIISIIFAYSASRSELDKSGRTILRNSVQMTMEVINLKKEEVKKGLITKEDAQEDIKIYLLGEKDKNNKRPINKNIDLGENGYIFVLSKTADELAHPSIEGQNTWLVKDYSGKDVYVAQDIIKEAINGGGYSYYTWKLPFSEALGEKVAYSEYEEDWEWIVVASIYTEDYNSGANVITRNLLIVLFFSVMLGVVLALLFAGRLSKNIRLISDSIASIDFDDLKYNPIEIVNRDETGVLSKYYNIMLKKLVVTVSENREIQKELKSINSELENRVNDRTKKLEETVSSLRMTQNQLEEKEKLASLGNLVAGVAHEINTPLGVSITSVSMLEHILEEFDEDLKNNRLSKGKFLDYIGKIHDNNEILEYNLDRAVQLVKSFKQIASDQIVEEKVKFNLKDYINKILISLKHEYKNTKYKIEVECPENFIIDSYPGTYSQILTNFIMNSLIHGLEGKASGRIYIRVIKEKDYFVIKYGDDGKGVSKDNISNIFKPFYTTKREKGGTGLGLSIVYNLISTKLQGSIKAYSEKDNGLEYTIYLPYNISEGES